MTTTTTDTTDYRQLRDASLAAMSEAERAEYAKAYADADLSGQLAELVYTLREDAGLTQTSLAKLMGSTQSSIARIEAGGHLPTIDLLNRLGKALGTPLTLSAAGHAVTFGGVPAGS
jgi:ribosome-binding protein aMBF1 (putative translation factor)